MSERLWVLDEADSNSMPDEKDVAIFKHAGIAYAFRINTDIVDNMDALTHEYNVLRTRPTATEVDMEISKLEKQAKQRKPRVTNGSSELELKILRLREICTTLAGILAERKGVEVDRIYQLFDISASW